MFLKQPEQCFDASVKLARARVRLKGHIGQMKFVGRRQMFPSGIFAKRETKPARIFKGPSGTGKALFHRQERCNSALRGAAEDEMARCSAFVAAGDHPARVKRCDTQSICCSFRRPFQKLRSAGSNAKRAANGARPPAASKQTRRVDSKSNPRRGFIAHDGSFEKSAAVAAEPFGHRNQSRHDHTADACPRATINAILLPPFPRPPLALDT